MPNNNSEISKVTVFKTDKDKDFIFVRRGLDSVIEIRHKKTDELIGLLDTSTSKFDMVKSEKLEKILQDRVEVIDKILRTKDNKK